MTLIEQAEHPMDSGLKAALKAAGGFRPLAREIGLSHVTVYRWKVVPVHQLLKVEKATGISREELRPDIFDIFMAPRPKKKTASRT